MATKKTGTNAAKKPDDTKVEKKPDVVRLSKNKAALVQMAVDKRTEARRLLKEAEEIESDLLDQLPINTPMLLPSGVVVTVKDQFAVKNMVWKSTPFSRYKFETTDSE